jgi:hypothetical protein
MKIRTTTFAAGLALLCFAGGASAQSSVYLTPIAGWTSLAGGLGSYLGGGLAGGLEVLVPRGRLVVGGGGEYGSIGVDPADGPGDFDRVSIYGTGRWQLVGRDDAKTRVTPYLAARVGWTRLTGDSVPQSVQPSGTICDRAPFIVDPCPYDNPRQSGLDLAGGAGVSLERGRLALDVTALVSMLELGEMHVDEFPAFGDVVRGAPTSGTGLSVRVGGRIGL